MAVPFVQGRLRQDDFSVTLETACGHCGRPMQITVDSDMNMTDYDGAAEPLVFMPQVDWTTFTEPNILDAY
jgi:hypothetical protein